MRPISHLLFLVVSNGIALIGAAYFVEGFTFSGNLQDLAIAAGILTGLNIVVRPLLRLLLIPFIVLTLGVGIVALNAGILYSLDFFLETITISGLPALLYATIIISIVNIAIAITARSTFRA